jgi:hypothetical protein
MKNGLAGSNPIVAAQFAHTAPSPCRTTTRREEGGADPEAGTVLVQHARTILHLRVACSLREPPPRAAGLEDVEQLEDQRRRVGGYAVPPSRGAPIWRTASIAGAWSSRRTRRWTPTGPLTAGCVSPALRGGARSGAHSGLRSVRRPIQPRPLARCLGQS